MNNRYMSTDEARVMNNLMPGNQNLGVGDKIKAALDLLGTIGRRIYLDPTRGLDTNDGLSRETAVKTLPVGYALLRDGYHDILTYIAGTSSISLSAAFVWAKSYTHFEGVCAPSHMSPRARIFQAATATGLASMFTNTGTGNVFKDLLFFQGVNDNTSKIAFKDSGARTVCIGCHFAGIGNATQDVAGAASFAGDGAEEGTYINCTFGLMTQGTRGANSSEILLDGTAKSLQFVDCKVISKISNAGHALVKVADATAIDDLIEFVRCKFVANSVNRAVALTQVFSIPAISQGMILLDDCKAAAFGSAPAWDGTGRGIILNNQPAAAASGGGGVMTIL